MRNSEFIYEVLEGETAKIKGAAVGYKLLESQIGHRKSYSLIITENSEKGEKERIVFLRDLSSEKSFARKLLHAFKNGAVSVDDAEYTIEDILADPLSLQ